MSPTDLPQGASPDNSDCFFLPGGVYTRPAVKRSLPNPLGSTPLINSIEDYQVSGIYSTIYLDSNGNIASDDPLAVGTETAIGTVTAGSRFKSVTYDQKQWFAFRNQAVSQAFSESPFVGCDTPAYWDGKAFWRVTSDPPGGGLSFTTTNVGPVNVVASELVEGPSVTSIVSSDLEYYSNPPNFDTNTGSYSKIQTASYTTLTVTLYGAPSTPLAVGQIIGLSGIDWTEGANPPEWPNGIAISEVLSTTSFKIAYQSTTQYVGGLGNFFYPNTTVGGALTRRGNIVTAFLAGTSATSPTLIQPGWYVSIADAEATPGSIPDGSVPNVTDELFQAMGGDFGSASLQGDGSGNVTITTENPIVNLPVGAWIYYYTAPPPAILLLSFSFPDAEHATIAVASCPYYVGQQVQLLDCTVGTTPTFVGNPTITITAVTSTSFTFFWPNGGGPQTLSAGTAIPVGTLYGQGYAQVTAVLSNLSFQIFLTGNASNITIPGVVYDIFGIQPDTGAGSVGISKSFQVLSVNTNTGTGPNSITWYQLGPDNSYIGTDTLTLSPTTAVIAGQRSAVVMFKSLNGALTGASLPITVSTNGGGQYLAATSIPIGPAGTAQRVIAFTPSGGGHYYYITPANIPQFGGLAPVVTLGTIINDNTTTSQVFDFSDENLNDGTQIDANGNNLFEQDVLSPCLGVIEYEGRLGWWGEVNNIKNLINMGFDGGYVGTLGATQPLGWDASEGDGAGALVLASQESLGFAYQMPCGSNSQIQQGAYQDYYGGTILNPGTNYLVRALVSASQPAPTGELNVDIYSPNSQSGLVSGLVLSGYTGVTPAAPGLTGGVLRAQGVEITLTGPQNPGIPPYRLGLVIGTISWLFYNASSGFYYSTSSTPTTQGDCLIGQLSATKLSSGSNMVISILSQPAYGGQPFQILAQIPFTFVNIVASWQTASFPVRIPSGLPADSVLRVYLSGTDPSQGNIVIDDLEIIDADQPILYDQMILSYYQNPFGYDLITGVLAVDPAESLTAAFHQRGYLYILSDQSLFQSQNNGETEPNQWDVVQFSDACGCSGPDAIDSGQELAWWGGRYGARIFNGNPNTKKISQELSSIWESINWDAQTTLWVRNDPVDRLLLFGIPTENANQPNLILPMSYRLSDDTYNIPDPIHVSQYSGKIICTDLGRRWSPWQLQMNSAAMCTRAVPSGGIAKTLLMGPGQPYGNFYTLDTTNYPPLNPAATSWNAFDDDFGQIFSYYTSYFFFPKDIEQNPLLSLYRKMYNYLSAHAAGIGQLTVVPLIDSLSSAAPSLKPYPLQFGDTGFDIEWHPNVRGDRVAWKFAPIPTPTTTLYSYQFSSDGTICTITTNGYCPFIIGSQVQLENCAVRGTPIFSANPIVTVTARTASSFTFTFSGSSSDIFSAGSAVPQSGYNAAMAITHLQVSGRKDHIFPVRGTQFVGV